MSTVPCDTKPAAVPDLWCTCAAAVGAVTDPSTTEQQEKTVYVVFYAGERARTKIMKVCPVVCALSAGQPCTRLHIRIMSTAVSVLRQAAGSRHAARPCRQVTHALCSSSHMPTASYAGVRLQICEAFGANRYPFPEESSRQQQMNSEVNARLRELHSTIDAGALPARRPPGSNWCMLLQLQPSASSPAKVITITSMQHAHWCRLHGFNVSVCRRAPQECHAAEHRQQPGGLDHPGQAREGGVPHPQQAVRGRHTKGPHVHQHVHSRAQPGC